MRGYLTKAQIAALRDLRTYGSLAPSGPGTYAAADGNQNYARRTLESLTLWGYAAWRSDGALFPLPTESHKFQTNYMDRALYNLSEVIDRARTELTEVDFDTLVGTGFSGGVVIPALALSLGKNFVLIRKENDDSHHGRGRLLGALGARWIFVDDFVSSGKTRTRVINKVESACLDSGHPAAHVGDYLYCNYDEPFQPAIANYRKGA